MEHKKIPEVRFSGFTEEWENYRLKDVCEHLQYGLNAAATVYDGINKYLRITDIEEKSRKFIWDGLTSPNYHLEDAHDFLLKNGDILFARTGASVGKTYIYRPEDGVVYFAGFLIRGRVKQHFSSELVFQYTLTDNYKKYVQITSQRSGQPGVNAQEYGALSIKLPSSEYEQQRIGSFFENLDHLLKQHQEQHQKLNTLKKAMLSKLFPKQGETVPEIRFKGFSGDWEDRSLGEIAIFRRGSFPQPYPNPVWYDKKNGKPFVQVYDVAENFKLKKTTKKKISSIAQPMSVFVEKGSVIITIQGSIGRIALTQYDAYVDRTLLIFTDFSYNIDKQYFIRVLDLLFEQEKKRAPGGIIKTITKEVLTSFKVKLPDIKEQEKIGNYFKNLDSLIENHSKQIEKLSTLKKACLSKMFV